MKKQILGVSLITVFLTVSIISCKKNDSKEQDFNTEATVQSDDQSQFSTQVDAVANETNLILESTGTLANKGEDMQGLVCNATVVADSANSTRTITITYNGADCSGFYSRTGIVLVSIPAGVHWKNAGATITIAYQNVVVTRVADNKKITINGSHAVTNVSGGLLINLPTLQTITHSITSDGMTVKFENDTQRTWQVSRKRVFTFSSGVVITTTGTHTEGNNTNIAEWGTNRFGNTFTSSITAPLVVRQDCNFRLVSGQIKHSVPLFTAIATFGLNQEGNPTTCPGVGHYYVKIMWTGLAGNSHTAIFPY
ncbi:MAG: hypothetical protein ABIR18_10440 [Chitinophagaceae bacterium]